MPAAVRGADGSISPPKAASRSSSPARSLSKESAQLIREREALKASLCKRIQKLMRIKPDLAGKISKSLAKQLLSAGGGLSGEISVGDSASSTDAGAPRKS